MAWDILERAAEGKAQLLSADRVGPGEEGCARAFLLTFDLGRVLISAEPRRGEVAVETVAERPEETRPALEEEPWWRILGSPLVGVQPAAPEAGDAQALRLQFQTGAENPRSVVVGLEGGALRAVLEDRGARRNP